MNTPPFFSIIVPCYNQAHFLSACINSILVQDFTGWEVIIVNDGSQDSTQEISETFASTNEKIKVIKKENGGLSSARNAGLSGSCGKYIQFLDADDLLLPTCLMHVYNNLQALNDPDLLRVGYCYINETNTEVLSTVAPGEISNPLEFIFTGNFGPAHSIFIKKKITEVIGIFDEGLKSAEDWDYWMRCMKVGAGIRSISTCLVCYRYVRNSMSRDAFRMYNALKAVALRAPLKDSRIQIDSAFNVSRDISLSATVKNQLLTCLGVSVMQGKIKESVNLFFQEQAAFNFAFIPRDFAAMYSYLSFRYWSNRDDLDFIFREIFPRYKDFFSSSGLTNEIQIESLKVVFNQVKKIKNHHRFGKVIGRIVNRFLY